MILANNSFGAATVVILALGLAISVQGDCPATLPRDCREVYQSLCTKSGVYTIDPGCGKPFQVYCDMKPNEQYIVFQRRRDGSEDFYRGWDDYVKGFGDLKREFWIGLEKLHCLTSAAPRTELKIDLADFDGNYKFAHYSLFYVGNSRTNYKLRIRGYKGTAGDSMSGPHSLNGVPFSTKDRDNNLGNNYGPCAVNRQGAWWYRDCTHSNLNGRYLIDVRSRTGIQWNTIQVDLSLKFAQMKLRFGD